MVRLTPWGFYWAEWAVAWIAMEFVILNCETGTGPIDGSWPSSYIEFMPEWHFTLRAWIKWAMSVTMALWLGLLILHYPYGFSA